MKFKISGLELKLLGVNSVLKVTSVLLSTIFFYLALFKIQGWSKEDYIIIKTLKRFKPKTGQGNGEWIKDSQFLKTDLLSKF